MGLTTQTYDIITRLAVGNGSLVYRAVDKTSLRQVALKLLAQDEDLNHQIDVPALLEAAPKLKQIAGSHVCQLIDAFEDDDGPVLVYEFANGINGAELPHKRKLNATEALDVAAQLISALRSGERQRTPHGDLKPSNLVFVEMPDGRPFTMVLDWGLARFRHGYTDDSLSYFAPERLNGGPPSHQADLFSAGALLFHLLTGKVLAGGRTPEEVLAGWSKARPEILAEVRPDLPPKFIQWICGMLALDPAKRVYSAVDAGTALATLNPPPPLVAPESIRPRPASQRSAQQSGASGVVPRSGVIQAHASGSRPPTSVSGVPVPNLVSTRVTASSAKTKKSNVAIVSLLLTVCTGAAGGAAWWFTQGRNVSDPIPSYTMADMRTPPPSVTKPAAKPAQRPLPEKLAAAPAKPKAKADAGKGVPKLKATSVKIALASANGTAKSLSDGDVFIATERFADGEKEDLVANSLGTGWAGPWNGNTAQLQPASLTHPSHPSKGGRLFLPAGSHELSRRIGPVNRLLRDPAKGGHFYFTVLIEHSDGTPAQGGELRINPLDPTDPQHPIQVVVADTGPGLRVSFADLKTPIEISDASQPIFVLCRLELIKSNGEEWQVSASLLVNPQVSAEAFSKGGKAITTTAKGMRLPKEFGILIQKQQSKATTIIDELRYGRHWEEMTFKPPQIDPPIPLQTKVQR